MIALGRSESKTADESAVNQPKTTWLLCKGDMVEWNLEKQTISPIQAGRLQLPYCLLSLIPLFSPFLPHLNFILQKFPHVQLLLPTLGSSGCSPCSRPPLSAP